MQLVPDGTFRKVRNNIDRLFDKNLTDLIRGIRNNKENEARYIAACIDEIKEELRRESIFVKANAIEKLAYLQMLGYDISWAAFNIIEVMSSTRYSEKRVGYLAAVQAFNDETDVLMLTTNLIRKDLQSSNIYDVGVALSGLACFATADLARDLVNDVVNLLSSSKPYVRKKAILLLYKIFLKYPESLRPTFARLRDRLEDQDPGVQSAAVNVVCELARKNPRNYLGLQNVFFKLLNTSSNNWMLIKIIKLFGSLVPHEPKLGRKLLEPLTNLINSTSAMSLLYECINTVIAILISISSEGPGDYTPSIQLCVQKLGVLIDDSDQNLKYLGLLAMGKILLTHPKAVQAHKDIVLRCLDDKDESIRLRALDLLYGMVSKKNIMEIVRRLMDHVDAAEGSFYRDELLRRIIAICSHDNYKYITNFEWYISVLVELTKVEGTKHGILIAEQIQDVTVRVQSIRHFSVSQMALLVENAQPLLKGNGGGQRNNVADVLLAAAWICGEFAQHVNNVTTVLDAMLRIKLSLVPGPLLSVFVQNIAKLYTFQLCKLEADDDWDGVESLDNLLVSKLPEYQYTDHLEAQERTCNLIAMLHFASKMHLNSVKIGEALTEHFEEELNPVAAKAQRKVPVPDGLNLDECINENEMQQFDEHDGEAYNDDEEEEEEEYDDDEPDAAAAQISPTSASSTTGQQYAMGHYHSQYAMGNYAVDGHQRRGGGGGSNAAENYRHREQSPDDAYHGAATTTTKNNSGGGDGDGIGRRKGGSKKQQKHKDNATTKTTTTSSAAAREEQRRRRQNELENNPFYVKERQRRPTRLPLQLHGTGDATNRIRNGGDGGAAVVAAGEDDGDEQRKHLLSATTTRGSIQSPLEIAGVLGLERYMQQQGATLRWKEAVTGSSSSKQKKTRTTTKTKAVAMMLKKKGGGGGGGRRTMESKKVEEEEETKDDKQQQQQRNNDENGGGGDDAKADNEHDGGGVVLVGDDADHDRHDDDDGGAAQPPPKDDGGEDGGDKNGNGSTLASGRRRRRRRADKRGDKEEVMEEEEQQQEHFVYKGDGEMPEGALSSSSDDELNNEFHALDVGDLDEALREREQMLRAYAATTTTTKTTTRSTRSHPFGGEKDEPKKEEKRIKKGQQQNQQHPTMKTKTKKKQKQDDQQHGKGEDGDEQQGDDVGDDGCVADTSSKTTMTKTTTTKKKKLVKKKKTTTTENMAMPKTEEESVLEQIQQQDDYFPIL